jgi:transcription elongation factor GreA
MSELTNNKKNVGPCIDSFERNIVFDKGNYVAHRSRGVGKIKEIDSDHIVIDFPGNQDQKMTIQMAISSLQPLGKEHIWVRFYENPDEVKGLFENDVPEFFRLLLSSFNKRMSLGEIKSEIVGRFVTAEEWSKWWNRTRTLLKKSESFTFNPKKKDELILLEREITQSDELISRFKGNSEWNKKLDIAMEALKNTDTESVENAIHDFIKHYREQEENRDLLKKIQSFLFVELASLALGEDEIQHKTTFEDIREIFRAARPNALIKFCGDTENVDIKREIVNLIIKSREDFPAILGDILFEVPIKVNRYVLGELNRLGKSDVLKNFIQLSFKRYREFPEILLWIAKSVLSGQWHYDWLSVNRQEIMLLLFRLLKPLVQIEKKGTRLKNSALENIFGTTNITVDSIKKGMLFEILKEADLSVIRRMAALFRDVPYVPDAHKENFLSLIQSIHPAFSMESEDREEVEEEAAESLFPEEGVILVSEQGLVKRREYLNHLINVDLPANSRDIGEAQEKGDLRENAEYKAAMERQQQLQAEILKLDNELKKARTIDPKGIRTDIVTIGSKVSVSTPDGSEIAYTILGPWDADTERNIISYLSPLGMGLIGKRVDEEAVLDGEKRFRIRAISLGL